MKTLFFPSKIYFFLSSPMTFFIVARLWLPTHLLLQGSLLLPMLSLKNDNWRIIESKHGSLCASSTHVLIRWWPPSFVFVYSKAMQVRPSSPRLSWFNSRRDELVGFVRWSRRWIGRIRLLTNRLHWFVSLTERESTKTFIVGLEEGGQSNFVTRKCVVFFS